MTVKVNNWLIINIVTPSPAQRSYRGGNIQLQKNFDSLFKPHVMSVQFGLLAGWPSEGNEGRFRRDPVPVLSAGGPCEQLWHGQGWPLFDVVHPPFPLPTTSPPAHLLVVGMYVMVYVTDIHQPS